MLESKESDHGVNTDLAAALLAKHVLEDELTLKNWDHQVEQWTARLQLLGQHMPELGIPSWSDEDRADAIARPILDQVYDITGMIRSAGRR